MAAHLRGFFLLRDKSDVRVSVRGESLPGLVVGGLGGKKL
jgi:hypothetical protein